MSKSPNFRRVKSPHDGSLTKITKDRKSSMSSINFGKSKRHIEGSLENQENESIRANRRSIKNQSRSRSRSKSAIKNSKSN
jgi:hypothetical protein